MVQELEEKLKKYWGVKNVVCVSSGTSAIMLALKAMGIKDHINVSAENFIATVSAPVWMGIKPIFFDFGEDPKSPALITHLYGRPKIVKTKRVIYDASHAFMTKYKGKSVLSYGDCSVISFHAVKTFQTVEGGAVVTNNDKLAEKVRWMRNFGLKTRYSYYGAGINCKMSEFHAAMGLCSLKLMGKVEKKYNILIGRYNKAFKLDLKDVTYYPTIYRSENELLNAIKVFEKHDIFPRRYFYPAMNKVFGGKECPVAEDWVKRVLCLPLYYDLTKKEQDLIIKTAKETNELLK